ncbi:MAG TPA: hypothetical protein VIE64_00775 [Solirubrobacterales bacterium]
MSYKEGRVKGIAPDGTQLVAATGDDPLLALAIVRHYNNRPSPPPLSAEVAPDGVTALVAKSSENAALNLAAACTSPQSGGESSVKEESSEKDDLDQLGISAAQKDRLRESIENLSEAGQSFVVTTGDCLGLNKSTEEYVLCVSATKSAFDEQAADTRGKITESTTLTAGECRAYLEDAGQALDQVSHAVTAGYEATRAVMEAAEASDLGEGKTQKAISEEADLQASQALGKMATALRGVDVSC